VLDGIQPGAGRKHPAREQTFWWPRQRGFGRVLFRKLMGQGFADIEHLNKRCCFRRLGWRALVATVRENFEGPELNPFADRHFQARDPRCNFVETREYGGLTNRLCVAGDA
tara:strand:+ start:6296 stop:6628 length:333 start_codon:yes stop_codon:yes gene_type:complete